MQNLIRYVILGDAPGDYTYYGDTLSFDDVYAKFLTLRQTGLIDSDVVATAELVFGDSTAAIEAGNIGGISNYYVRPNAVSDTQLTNGINVATAFLGATYDPSTGGIPSIMTDARRPVLNVTDSTAVIGRLADYVITYNGVCQATLALPIAGTDDGARTRVVDAGGHAHVITTPAHGINGNKSTATFGGTLGTAFNSEAFNGHELVTPATGITLGGS